MKELVAKDAVAEAKEDNALRNENDKPHLIDEWHDLFMIEGKYNQTFYSKIYAIN